MIRAHVTDAYQLIETMFEDVSRIETEGRIGAVKDRISGLLEQAASKQPCLLILDNLHMLLGPDDEVRGSPAH